MSWLINVSEIQPGHSAILNENYIIFYMIHCVSIILIIISLVTCIIVINSILCLRKERWDFSDRFPLYLAIADGLWGVSHLADHLIIVTTRRFPQKDVIIGLGIYLWVFLAYQQLMHCGLAAYTYLRIVRRKSLNLGKLEWRLHAFCVTMIGFALTVFYPLGSFGCQGYWFLLDVKTTEGLLLGLYIASAVSIQALLTLLGYRSILIVIEEQKQNMMAYRTNEDTVKKSARNQYDVACQYLNTFVWVSLCLYFPLALTSWANLLQVMFGVIEPITVFVMAVVSNSSGLANGLGYLRNQRDKARRAKEKMSERCLLQVSNSSSYSIKPV